MNNMEGIKNLQTEVEQLISQGFEEVWIPKGSPASENALKQLHNEGEVIALDGDVPKDEARRVFRKRFTRES